ncbi:hypothetical protein GCM10023216_05090 [Isoptericola chiayiensis]|uniref:DUF2142 domain-containing protein n=1 Tax=Isoptericola chiayiensis TaxID=579446 RepID=A0ABP8Y3N1_9MICO
MIAVACHNGRVTRDTPSCERAYRRTLALLTLAVALWSVAWAVLTPGFRAPDEQNHLNSAIRLAYGGGWPAPGDAHFAPVIDQAVAESTYPSDLPGRFNDRPQWPQFVELTPVPTADRIHIDVGNALPAPGTSATVDQMTQHPPAYYALGAAALRATGTADAQWDVALLALRLLDVALFAATVPLAASTTRRLTGSRSAALLAAPFPMLIPQVGHIMGAANNDALVVLTGAGVTYLAARVVTGDLRWRVVVGLGLVLGVGLLTKVMLAFAIPVVVAAYLLAPPGPTAVQRAWRAFVALAVAFVVGGWWWARNWLVDGAVQPVGLPRDYASMAQVPGSEVLPESIGRTAQAFFGNLGWLEIRMHGTLVALASTLLVVAVLAAVVLPGARRGAFTIALLPLALAAGVVANAVSRWAETGVLVALQGRYIFGGLTALAALFAIALWQAARRREHRTAVVVPVLTALAGAAAVAGLAWGFAAFYRAPGDSAAQAWERWVAWSPLDEAVIAAVLVVVALGLLAGVVAAWRWAALTRGLSRPSSQRTWRAEQIPHETSF